MASETGSMEHPDVVRAFQKEYIDAGSQVLYSPTFGANRVKLEENRIYNQVREYNLKLASISKEVAGDRAYVAGDISPTGKFIAPLGDVTFEELVDIYTEQAQALEDAGVDLFIIPSSVHETILVPDDGVMKRTELESMIRDINANEVSPKDRLSDTLYHYDSKDHKLERAVDFEERKEMEHSIGRKVERSSIKDKLKSAEARVNEQMAPSRPARAQEIG